MNIDIKKYLDDKTIILDNIITYPKHIIDEIRMHKKIISDYIKEETKIKKINKQRNYYPTNNPNPYFHALNNFVKSIKLYLVENKFNAIAFHATRLLPEEVIDIKTNGLKYFDRNKHNMKLDLLTKYEFEINDIRILKQCSYVDNNRQNKIYLFYNIDTANSDTGLNDFFECWGGEITNWQKEKYQIIY